MAVIKNISSINNKTRVASAPVKSSMKKHSRKNNKKATNVSFGKTACRLYLKDLTKEEVDQVWYKAEEYQQIRSNVYDDLRKAYQMYAPVKVHSLSSSSTDAQEPPSLRGLEHHLVQGGVNVKKLRRRRYVHHFLYTHKQMKLTEPNELGAFAKTLSGHDSQRAHRMGNFDAWEAFQVHREARLQKRRMAMTTSSAAEECTPERVVSWDEDYSDFNVPKAKNLSKTSRRKSPAAPLA